MHGPSSYNALTAQNFKLKKLKLQQLDCVYSEEAMAPFKASLDGFAAYLRGTADPEATEPCSYLLEDLLILPLSVALCKQPTDDSATPSRYIPLDMVHLMPFLQEFAPDIILPCVVHTGLSSQQIWEEQSRRSMLYSGYYKQKTAGFLKQLKASRPGVFEAKQLATLFNVSESGLYKDKPAAKMTSATYAPGCSNDTPTYDPLDGLTDISEF